MEGESMATRSFSGGLKYYFCGFRGCQSVMSCTSTDVGRRTRASETYDDVTDGHKIFILSDNG